MMVVYFGGLSERRRGGRMGQRNILRDGVEAFFIALRYSALLVLYLYHGAINVPHC